MPPSEEEWGTRMVSRFDGARCVHARNCVLQEPTVFRANVVGPWIAPDAIDADELAAVARACPSGAIQYERLDGAATEAPPPVNTIRVRENGPLEVRADLALTGQAPRLRATLCRCGHSAHKPFCDGAHATACFAASGEARTQDAAPLAVRNRLLTTPPAHDGPLRGDAAAAAPRPGQPNAAASATPPRLENPDTAAHSGSPLRASKLRHHPISCVESSLS